MMAATHVAVLLEARCSWCLRVPPRSCGSPPRWSRWNRMTGPKSQVGKQFGLRAGNLGGLSSQVRVSGVTQNHSTSVDSNKDHEKHTFWLVNLWIKKPIHCHYPLAGHWDLNPVTFAKGLKIGNLVSLCFRAEDSISPLFFLKRFACKFRADLLSSPLRAYE